MVVSEYMRLSKRVRYLSMRVHGTSAHVTADPTDMPDRKTVSIDRVPAGTSVRANYPAHLHAFFSIPTPLEVEREVALTYAALHGRDQEDVPVRHVFEGSSIWVEKILFTIAGSFDSVEVWDGQRRVFVATEQEAFGADPYVEAHYPNRIDQTYQWSVGKRIYDALGLVFNMHFQDWDSDRNHIVFHSARAIFFVDGD